MRRFRTPLSSDEIAMCAMGGAVFAILGAILGAVTGDGSRG